MGKIQLDGLLCEKCSYTWLPMSMTVLPKVCPKCKSKDWNNDHIEKTVKKTSAFAKIVGKDDIKKPLVYKSSAHPEIDKLFFDTLKENGADYSVK